MAKDKQLAEMSDEEFMDSWTALGSESEAIKDRLREYSQEHQRRTRKEQLAKMAEGMSDADLALLQECHAEGIESQEEVNG